MKKTLWLTACLALTVAGCAEMQTQPQAAAKPAAAAPTAEFNAAVANAEKEIAAAKKANNLWRDTEKFLDEAKKAMEAGKADEAVKLANKAMKQAQLAQKQASAEASAKPHFPK
jgi:formate-dependent nitrite reductase cytochrome c552 subunit